MPLKTIAYTARETSRSADPREPLKISTKRYRQFFQLIAVPPFGFLAISLMGNRFDVVEKILISTGFTGTFLGILFFLHLSFVFVTLPLHPYIDVLSWTNKIITIVGVASVFIDPVKQYLLLFISECNPCIAIYTYTISCVPASTSGLTPQMQSYYKLTFINFIIDSVKMYGRVIIRLVEYWYYLLLIGTIIV